MAKEQRECLVCCMLHDDWREFDECESREMYALLVELGLYSPTLLQEVHLPDQCPPV